MRCQHQRYTEAEEGHIIWKSLRLSELEATVGSVYKITTCKDRINMATGRRVSGNGDSDMILPSQGVDDHEDQLVKRSFRGLAITIQWLILSQTR